MANTSVAYDINQAFDPAASVFVSANAGAGKTSLLTNRVLRLLLHGVKPSRILCLTFTNAAAAEMANRVLKELGAWVMADDVKLGEQLAGLTGQAADKKALARARSLFADVLESPEGIRIQTIHGFCQSLLRRFPVEAGISTHFTVMDTRTEQELLQEARLRLFSRAQTQDPLLQQGLYAIAQALGESGFHALMSEMIQHKRRIRSLFAHANGMEAAIDTVWQVLDIPRSGTLQALIESHFSYDDATLTGLRDITRQLLVCEGRSDRKTGDALALWLEQPEGRMQNIAGYISAFLTDKGEARKQLCTKKALPDAALVALLVEEQQRIVRFSDRYLRFNAATRTTHMLHVAETLLALYREQKSFRALMDYDDLIMTACDLLKRPGIAPWVLFKLDGGIDHILVDEAQDTSPEQWEIIDALTQEFFSGLGRKEQERSLFVVGDEKQSIYSFQGADPTALGRKKAYFSARIRDAAKLVHTIALTHSFRSTREVLAAVDAVFAQPAARSGLTFSDGELTHIPTRLSYPGIVELWPLVEPQEEEGVVKRAAATQLARHIAETIRQWIDSGVMLEAKGRPVQAGDIMILVRSRTSLVDRLVRSLKKRGVPVAGHDRMTLGDNLAVQDLMALGQCLLLPEDDLTLASVLKSPLFEVSEEDLFTLAWQREGRSVWMRLHEEAGRPPFAQALALLTDLRARADFVSPYELYSYLLDTLGARRRITGRMGEEYNDPIDEFLGQALVYERSHTASLQGFLHWLQTSDSQIKRDMEQARDCVRIMTVHGAKGLQAPIVFLPDTVEVPRMKDTLLWYEGNGMIPFWPASSKQDDAFCAGLRDQQKQASLAEYRRLLYVAMTRAEDRLYICGATGKEKISDQCWYSLVKTGLSAIAEPLALSWGEGLRLGQGPQAGAVKAAVPLTADIGGRGIFDFLDRPVPNEPTPPHPLVPSRLPGDEPAGASPLAETAVYLRGNLIHRLLQYVPEIAPPQRMDAARTIAESFRHGMNDAERTEAISEVLKVIDDPQFAFLFAKDSLAEVPVAGCVKVGNASVAVAGQIDRLYVGAKEVWIVDFKSGRTPPVHEGDIPAAYLRQMRLYQLLLQQIYPEKTARCAILWTAAARLTVLDDALLDEVPASSYI